MADQIRLELIVDDKGTATVKRFSSNVEAAGKKGERAFDQTTKSAEKLTSEVASTTSKLLKFGVGFTAFAGVAAYALIRVVKDWEQLSGVQEKAEAGVLAASEAMGRGGVEFQKTMLANAAALQNLTTFGDENILMGTKFLLTYKGISNDIMPRVQKTMTDVAALMGGDFKSAANMLGKASMGMIGELRRVGITVDEDVFKMEGFVGVLKQIEQQVGGQAAALRATKAGGLEAFGNVVDDIKEKFGLFSSTLKQNF